MMNKLMIALLFATPVALQAMEAVDVDAELSKLEQGEKIARGPLADFMDSCGIANEEELAKRVRSRIEHIDRHGHDTIIKGLTFLARKNPETLVKLQSVVAQKRAVDGVAEQPVDQIASLTAAVDILNGIHGALTDSEAIANNWNQTSTVGNIEKILEVAVQTLVKLEDRAEQTSCWGLCKRKPKPVAPAAVPAADPVASRAK